MKTTLHFRQYVAQFFLEWKMFQAKVEEKLEIHILGSKTFFEYCAVYEITWENIVDRDRLQTDNMAHVHCMLDT